MSSACPITRLTSYLSSMTAGTASIPTRLGTLAYGLLAYLSFFATITYAIGFLGNW
jgi:hypothetical protein